MAEKKKDGEQAAQNRRRILIVNPQLQKRLIRDVSLVPIMALIAGVVVTAVSFRLLLLDAVDAGVALPGVYPFLGCLAGFVFLAAFVTLNMATRISNRVAGPLYRLHRAMEEIAEGNLDCRIHFREGDYLEETAEVFNRMADRLAVRADGASEDNNAHAKTEAVPRDAGAEEGMTETGAAVSAVREDT